MTGQQSAKQHLFPFRLRPISVYQWCSQQNPTKNTSTQKNHQKTSLNIEFTPGYTHFGVFFQPPWRFSHVFLWRNGAPWFFENRHGRRVAKGTPQAPKIQRKGCLFVCLFVGWLVGSLVGWLVGWLGEKFRPKECLCFCLKRYYDIIYYLLDLFEKIAIYGKLSELFGIFLSSEFLLTNFPLRQGFFLDSKVNHEECIDTTNHDS